MAAAIVLMLGALAPATASGSVTIGSASVATPPEGGTGCFSASCVFSDSAIPGRLVTSPVNGIVTSWGMHATSPGTSVRLRVMRPMSGSSLLFVTSSQAQSSLSSEAHTFAASVPIGLGDRIGIELSAGSVGRIGDVNPIAGANGQIFDPSPADGTQASPLGDFPDREFLLNAQIEPTNDATLVSIRKNKKKGTATLVESVPNPGTLRIAEGPVKPQTIEVAQPGTVTTTLRPKKKVRKKLKHRGKVAGGIDLLFTPSFGTQSRDTTKLVLRLKRRS